MRQLTLIDHMIRAIDDQVRGEASLEASGEPLTPGYAFYCQDPIGYSF